MIFGLEAPQIKIGNEIIVLEKSNLQPDFLTPVVIEYVSPLNGDKNFIVLGDYAGFRIQINSFETISATTLFLLLKAKEKNLCVFFPHKDGQPIKDKAGNDCLFFISSVKPYYLENDVEFDMVEITFNSVGFVDLSGTYSVLGFGYQFAYNFGYGV